MKVQIRELVETILILTLKYIVIAPWRERKTFCCFIFTKRFKSLTCEFQAKSHANQNLKARKRYLTNQLTEGVFYKGNLEFCFVSN